MVAQTEKEPIAFKQALNARIQELCKGETGEETSRPAAWLYKRLEKYRMQHPRAGYAKVSLATCGYWVRGDKVATHKNASMLMAALNVSRGQLFGEQLSGDDDRLARIIERWEETPEHIKSSIYGLVSPEQGKEAKQEKTEARTENLRAKHRR